MAKYHTRVEVLTVVCGGFPVLCAECALSSSSIPILPLRVEVGRPKRAVIPEPINGHI